MQTYKVRLKTIAGSEFTVEEKATSYDLAAEKVERKFGPESEIKCQVVF